MNLSKYLEFIKFFFGSDNDLAIIDDAGVITFAGKNLCRFLNLPPEKVIGEKIDLMMDYLSPELEGAWREVEDKLIAESGPAILPVEFIHGEQKIYGNIVALRVEDDLVSLGKRRSVIISIWQASIQDGKYGNEAISTITLRRAERYRKLFEHAPVGIFRSKLDGVILEANSTIASMLKFPSVQALMERNTFDIYANPKERAVWLSLIMQATEPFSMPIKVRCYDNSEIQANIFVRPVRDENNKVRYIDGIFEDISAKNETSEIFDKHTIELATLQELANRVNQVLTVDEVVNAAIEEIFQSGSPDICMLFLRNGDTLELKGIQTRGNVDFKNQSHQVGECLCGLAFTKNSTVISQDIFDDGRCTRDECKLAGVHSFIAIPMRGKDENFGVLCLASFDARDFTQEKIFLEAFAAQTSIAMKNALTYESMEREIFERKRIEKELQKHQRHLENLVEERTQEIRLHNIDLQKEVLDRNQAREAERDQRALAQALENTAAALNQTQDLDEVLDRILVNLESVVPHDSANIMLLDRDGIANVVRYKGNPSHPPNTQRLFSNFSVSDTPTLQRMRSSLRPMVLTDVEKETEWIPQLGSEWIKSYVAAPIYYGEKLLGYLNLVSSTGGFYTFEHAERLLAFANHASIAIRNVHLFTQAREIATLEERQRLAREMHDGVSQTLFTASVIAETLYEQWERSPGKGKEGLEKIERLTRGALAEMRSILLELRPDALVETDLGELIEQLGKGAMSYLELSITSNLDGRHKLPENIQLPLYRMAQEVFNNIVKHARATHVSIDFKNTGDYVYISISDNGKGFHTEELRDDSFGLKIMQERAERIGASLNVISEPQRGTNVTIIWRPNREFV